MSFLLRKSLTSRQLEAVENNAFNGGVSVVAFGDSEIDIFEYSGSGATALVYDSATGVITATQANHYKWTGLNARIWNYNYASLQAQRVLPITRTGVNTYTLTLPDKPSDIPATLAATLFCLPEGCFSFAHWIGLLQMKFGAPLNMLRNAAQSGDTSSGCLSRLANDVLSYQPALVIMQLPGLNDQTSANNIPLQTTIANNRAILSQLAGAGIKVICLTTNPAASGEARANIQTMQRIYALNQDALSYAKTLGGVFVVDAYNRIVDPATGYANASYLKSDLIHYNYKGSKRIADMVEPVFASWFPNQITPLVQTALDCNLNQRLTGVLSVTRSSDGVTVTVATSVAHNWRVGESFRVVELGVSAENGVYTVQSVPSSLSFTYQKAGSVGPISAGSASFTRSANAFNNPLMLTAGGTVANGVTGTTAARLTCTNLAGTTAMVAAASMVSAPDGAILKGVGNAQRIVITSAALNDRPCVQSVGTTSFTNQLLPNRNYQFRYRLKISSTDWNLSPISELYGVFDVVWSDGTRYSVQLLGGWDGTENPTVSTDIDWCVVSPVMLTVPPSVGATISAGSFNTYARFGGAVTSTVTIDFSQLSIVDVTP